MKKYIYIKSIEQRANAIDKDGNFIFVREVPSTTKVNMPYIEATNMSKALVKLQLTAYSQPVIAPQPRSLTKRELVDKLIDLGVAEEFNALLATLPSVEKLRWEASPTISPNYPFIRDNSAMLCAALAISEEQFIGIFQ